MRAPTPRRSRGAAPAALALLYLAFATGSRATEADALSPAVRALAAGDSGAALAALEVAFEAGHPTPSSVLVDPRFAVLRDSSPTRGAWRDLLRRFVSESRVTIAPSDEPGTRMRIEGRVTGIDGAPIVGAVVELYHTDASGHYEPGGAIGNGSNPRLFGFVRSDEAGRFVVDTIEPAPYPGSGGPSAHIHYRAHAAGFRPATDEFHPYSHPATAAQRATELARGRPTSQVRRDASTLVCLVAIPLQPTG